MAQNLIPVSRLETLMGKPRVGMSLDELREELNLIAQIRNGARLGFCQRLAIAYLTIVGRPYGSKKRDGKAEDFFRWCYRNLHTANGKAYRTGTLHSYLAVGFSNDPAGLLEHQGKLRERRNKNDRQLVQGIKKAIAEEKKIIPMKKLTQKLPEDIATEVNRLMTAWEQASPAARSQFMYMITGKRVA